MFAWCISSERKTFQSEAHHGCFASKVREENARILHIVQTSITRQCRSETWMTRICPTIGLMVELDHPYATNDQIPHFEYQQSTSRSIQSKTVHSRQRTLSSPKLSCLWSLYLLVTHLIPLSWENPILVNSTLFQNEIQRCQSESSTPSQCRFS